MVPSPQPLAHSASPAKPRQQPGAFPQDRLQGQDFPPDALALPQPPAPVSSAPSSWHPGSPTAAPTVSPGLTPSSQGAGGQSLGPSQSPPSPVKGTHTHIHHPNLFLPPHVQPAASAQAEGAAGREAGASPGGGEHYLPAATPWLSPLPCPPHPGRACVHLGGGGGSLQSKVPSLPAGLSQTPGFRDRGRGGEVGRTPLTATPRRRWLRLPTSMVFI